MWSPIVLCFLVGFAFASNPGWKQGNEYVYKISGRSLASLNEISNQQSGFLFKATLRLQPQSDGKLRGKFTKPQYSEIHADLHKWCDRIPEEQLSWKPLTMSGKPFEVEMQQGRIVNLLVSQGTPIWEANMIKSAMSQFQLNTNGANLIDSKLNTLPENGDYDNDALYTVMEDTITGNTETLYQIRPLPDYLVQADSQEAQYLDAAQGEDVIEVVKHKNFTNNIELPSYYFGFDGLTSGKPATNQMGSFLARDSTSRMVLTGTLKNFVIRQSYTVNQIFVSPTLSEKKSGVVVSAVNVTLENIKSQDEQIPEVSQPIRLGNLVYSYEKPYTQSNEVYAKPTYQWRQEKDSDREQIYVRSNKINRFPRSLRQQDEQEYDEQEQYDGQKLQSYKQKLSDLKDAPQNPLLPFTMGYESMSIKNKIDVVQEVQKLAKEIGKRMHESGKDHYEELLDMFATMVSLIRIMDAAEIQQAAKDLYTNNKHGVERAIWASFRDGVAESGTGPALLVIKEWIKTQKIRGEEASQVATAMTTSARQPTLEYFRTMFELVKQPEVQKEWPLNDTILMAYTDLIRKVYFDSEELKQRYPVKSYQPFRTQEGERFIKKEVIPYFAQQLKQAIQHAETHKIHALIRILGNTGSYDILPVFELYLEGQQQVSQFQRLLMIVSMDKLVQVYPETAQNVLFRIYQNVAETREVRMAAVYQLMRTVPSAQMLQVMATYTNIDTDDYVNAAVKSSIEYAADLTQPEFAPLRKVAIPAKSLLTDKVFGLRHGGNYLRGYFIEELQRTYKEAIKVFGSDDSMSPKGFIYTLRQNQGGIRYRIADVQALVSSFDDLLKLAQEQTENYQRQEKQQREHSQEQEQNQWSSQNIAKLLKIEPEDQEQLEAFLRLELGPYRTMFSFDNMTLEDLAEEIRKWEEELQKEKQVSLYKLTIGEMALSVPTELGLPFLFTHDVPMLFKAVGKLSAKVQPQLSQNGKIQVPEKIELQSDMEATFSRKVQSRLSVTAPFNHKQYFAGYDKHFQVNVPARIQVQIDVKNQNAEIEVELKPKKDHMLIHYVTRPYTSIVDVTSFAPMSAQQKTKYIRQQDLQAFDSTFGKKETGMAFRVEMTQSRQFLDSLRLADILSQQNIFGAAKSLLDDNTVQYSYLNVNYRPQESTSRKAILRLSYEQKYNPQSDAGSSSEWILNENAEPSQRQEELMKKIAADIKNVEVYSLDSSLEFKGEQQIKYILTGAVAKSTVDPKSRVMISYKRASNGTPKPHEMHLVAKSYIPNTNALDIEYTLQNEPMADTEIKVKFGNSEEPLSKIDAQLKYRRSEERKQYLKELPMYKECKEQMRAGNKQLPACLNMTMSANLLDSIDLKFRHENLEREYIQAIQRFFQAIQFFAEPKVEILDKDMSIEQNELKMQVRFHADLQAVNVTVKSPNQESRFKNIEVDEISRQILVVHPVFHVRSRLSSQIFARMDIFRDSCVVDKTYINTFSNLTYPADISKHWTVMLQYIAGNSERYQQKSVEERLRSQPENYVVLVRESQEAANKKDIKMVISTPKSNYKIVEIEMTPNQASSEAKAKVTVNGQEIKVSEKESHDINGRFIQIYALPNGEVKVEIQNAFYIIYDGTRARISSTQSNFQNNLAGLCGQYTYQEKDDMTTPQGCVARDPEDFVKTYEVEGQKGQQMRAMFQGKSQKCIEKNIPLYANVIAARDYREHQEVEQSNRCTYFQTKYVQEGDQICFTLRAHPTCSSQCHPKTKIDKSVPVHCIKKDSNVAGYWKKQIDNGSSPDFTNQREHKYVKMTLPESCSQ